MVLSISFLHWLLNSKGVLQFVPKIKIDEGFMKKIFLIIAFCTLFCSCIERKQKQNDYVRFAWWGDSERSARTAKAALVFEEANESIKIELETDAKDAYFDKMNLCAATGTLPDLMQHSSDSLLIWAKAGRLQDLSPFINSGVIRLSDFGESEKKAGMYNGKIFGICAGSCSLGVAVNKDFLEKAGVAEVDENWTWSDFENIAKTVFGRTGVKTLPFGDDSAFAFESFLRQNGDAFFSEDGRALGENVRKNAEEFFLMLFRLAKLGAFLTDADLSAENASGAQTWNRFLWKDEFYDVAQNEKVLPVPKKANAENSGEFLVPSLFYSIPEGAVRSELAACFLDFLVNNESATEILGDERGVSAKESAKNDLSIPVLDAGSARQKEVRRIFCETTRAVILREISVSEGARIFCERASIALLG